jgi:PAS domain S-box-containing protein
LARSALRQSDDRFRAIADLVPELLWSSEPSGSAQWFNQRWLDYTGQTMEEAQGWGWVQAIHAEDREASQERFLAAIQAGEPFERQHRLRRHDGESRWFLVRAEPFRDEAGEILQWFGSGTDIHEQGIAMENLRQSESRAQLLLAELQHRVRNTLGVVRSIAQRSAETSTTVQDYASHVDGRLSAFARVQAAVTRDPSSSLDLRQLIEDELLAYNAKVGEQVTRIEGPTLELSDKPAEVIGMAIHELTNNAVKYGAFASADGRLSVDWSISEDTSEPMLVLKWQESGVAIPTQPARRGFGTELLEGSIAYEMEGQSKLEFREDGVRCTITLPCGD